MRRIRSLRARLRRPAPGTVIACLALFVALGGSGAWAAAKIGAHDIKRGAVRSKQIKNGQVKTRDLHNGAVTAAKVAANTLTGAQIDESTLSVRPSGPAGGDLTGSYPAPRIGTGKVSSADVADNSLTGADIDESTLGQVPDAATLGGRAPATFLSSSIYKNESPVEAGTTLGDGTSVIDEACNAGDVLLSGGPANVSATSTLLESFPAPGTTNGWQARINKNGHADNFSVVVLCARQ